MVFKEKTMKALLVIDMFNRLDFPGAECLAPRAAAIAEPLAALVSQVAGEGGAVFYANDDLGPVSASLSSLKQAMLERGGASAAIAGHLPIPAGAELVNKPQHSAFFETSLGQRLRALAPDEVWVAGVAADLCVLASAVDASMRGFAVRVPADVVASESEEKRAAALLLLRHSFKLDTRPWRGPGGGVRESAQSRQCVSGS
ncbi:cysteine hydrolase [Pseudoxanthomonas spadix]|nr:cysteine hydrolase [Pseudoxanthomonas spadix]